MTAIDCIVNIVIVVGWLVGVALGVFAFEDPIDDHDAGIAGAYP